MSYDETFRRWQRDPEGFWRGRPAPSTGNARPSGILDDSRAPLYSWFRDGVLNTCHNAIDRHVEGGRADQAALIYDSAVAQTVRSYSYRELRDEVAAAPARCAAWAWRRATGWSSTCR
jgi:propionyl-CoA synthetase